MFRKPIFLIALFFWGAMAFGQAQRLVLFEEFTGENCTDCATTNPYVDARIQQNPAELVCIRYQTNIPSGGSIYHQDVNDELGRMSYYLVNSAPWGQQDGALWDSSSSNTKGNQPYGWATNPAFLDSEYTKPSPFAISVTQVFSPFTDSVYASVTITGADSFTVSAAGKLNLRVAMVEDLAFSIPPGSNGETVFPNVVRHMYPNALGTALVNTWTSGQTQIFNFSGAVPSSIKDKTKLRFVAFIQDDNNKHVLQAGQSQPSVFALDVAMHAANTAFINCTGNYTPGCFLFNNGSASITSDTLEVVVDGTSTVTHGWAGTITPGDSAYITLPPITLSGGLHTINLIARNPNNSIDGNAGNDTFSVVVGVTVILPDTVSVVQGFESALGAGWLNESVSQLPYGWSRQTVGNNSNYSYQLDFWDITEIGAVSNFYAPAFTLAGLTHAVLRFDHAYAPFDYGKHSTGLSGYSKDSLLVEVSINCGTSWQTVYALGDTSMATTSPNNLAPFRPSTGQWVGDRVDLTAFAGNPEVLLRFKGISGNGNELYIDNINIFDPVATDILATGLGQSLQLYPNPTNELLNVNIDMGNPSPVEYHVTDISGRVVIMGRVGLPEHFVIHTESLQDGLYFLTVNMNDEKISKPFDIIR